MLLSWKKIHLNLKLHLLLKFIRKMKVPHLYKDLKISKAIRTLSYSLIIKMGITTLKKSSLNANRQKICSKYKSRK
jgi:hypothetical protein